VSVVEKIRRKVKNLRPHIQSAYVVYALPKIGVTFDGDDEFEVREVTTPDDPLIDQIVAPWQRSWARQLFRDGRGRIIVALVDGRPVGRVWEIFASEKSLFSGIPRMALAHDERLFFDLFVEREYRRSNIGSVMANYVYSLYPGSNPETGFVGPVKYAYGFISYENSGSILWHYANGFNVAQTVNYLSIGERVKWRIPFSDMPRMGPWSRKNRIVDDKIEMFGTALFPNL
jgi:GNAT superfamily N-acetyltransferase